MGGIRYTGTGSKGSSVSYESKSSAYSPLKQVISLLEDLDQKGRVVAKREQELEQAKKEMASATQKVQKKLESLDPSTRDLVKGILGQIDGKTSDSLTQEETKGKSR